MRNRSVAKYLLALVMLAVSLAYAQSTVAVLEDIETFQLIAATEVGAELTTSVLLCTTKDTLLSVLDAFDMRSSDATEPLLSAELATEVDTNCWLDESVPLNFVAVHEDEIMMTQALATEGFNQVSIARVVEVTASGVSLGRTYTLAGQTVAFDGSYEIVEQTAYFAGLERSTVTARE